MSHAWTEALERLERDPRDVDAYVQLARCSSRCGDQESANEALRIAFRLLEEGSFRRDRQALDGVEEEDRDERIQELILEKEKMLKETMWRDRDAEEAKRRRARALQGAGVEESSREDSKHPPSQDDVGRRERGFRGRSSSESSFPGFRSNHSNQPSPSTFNRSQGTRSDGRSRHSEGVKTDSTWRHDERGGAEDSSDRLTMDNTSAWKEMNHYELLDIDESASLTAVRKAYLRKIVTAHPDKGGNAEMFSKLQDAYNTLVDYMARQHYDRTVHMQKTGSPLPARDTRGQPQKPSVPQDSSDLTEEQYNDLKTTEANQMLACAKLRMQEREWELALQSSTEAIRLAIAAGMEDMSAFYIARARINQALERYHHALADAEEASCHSGSNDQVLMMVGELHIQLEQWEDAESVLSKLIRRSQDPLLVASAEKLLNKTQMYFTHMNDTF